MIACPRCGHAMAASAATIPGRISCAQCGYERSPGYDPTRPPATTDKSARHAWHRTLCYRVLTELRQCDAAALADVAVSKLMPAELRGLELQLAEVLHRVRLSLDTPEGALGQELGAVLMQLGRLPSPARERVGDAVLRVLPLHDAPDVLSACLDILSDVGVAACMATEAIAGVETVDLGAARPQ